MSNTKHTKMRDVQLAIQNWSPSRLFQGSAATWEEIRYTHLPANSVITKLTEFRRALSDLAAQHGSGVIRVVQKERVQTAKVSSYFFYGTADQLPTGWVAFEPYTTTQPSTVDSTPEIDEALSQAFMVINAHPDVNHIYAKTGQYSDQEMCIIVGFTSSSLREAVQRYINTL